MPLLRELYPSVDATMQANIARLSDAGEVYRAFVDDLRARVIHKYESKLPTLPVEICAMALSDIKALNPQRTLLFELLRPYGFNAATVDDILAARGTGRLFYSPTHVAELHRGQLLIAPQFQLSGKPSARPTTFNFQLSTRPWRPGDRFRPKGMRGTRLVSDFLKDLHLSRIERQYVMVSVDAEGVIRSVIGLRDAE
jgi:tRNA(Ile)-lysidine synthase